MPEAADLSQAIAKLKSHADHPEVCQLHNETVTWLENVGATLTRVELKLQLGLDNIQLAFREHINPDGPSGHIQRHELQALEEKVDAIARQQKAQAEDTAGLRKDFGEHVTASRVDAARQTAATQVLVALFGLLGILVPVALKYWLK